MKQSFTTYIYCMVIIATCLFLNGCGGCVNDLIVDPPQLTLDDHDTDAPPGGDPSDWGSDLPPDIARHMTYGSPRHNENNVPGGDPSDWGSDEPIMNDGFTPGQPRQATGNETPGGNPSDWGSNKDMLADGSVPGLPRQATDNETPGGDPSDWDSDESIMNDGSIPGLQAEAPGQSHSKVTTDDDFGFFIVTKKPRLSSKVGWHIPYQDNAAEENTEKPKTFQIDLDWLTDDKGALRQPINPSTAYQAGLGDLSFNGNNRASGDIFNMRFTNYSGFDLKLMIPFGSFFTPSDSEYQRMVSTAPVIAETPDRGTTTSIPLRGFCADPKKYPPAPEADEPGLTWTINPSFFPRKIMGGGMTEIDPPTLDLDEADTTPGSSIIDELYPHFLQYKEPQGCSIPENLKFSFFDPFLRLQLTAPYFPSLAEKMFDEGAISVPGFPEDKARITIAQWGYWNMFSAFTSEDGRERIDKQTENNPNITTPMKEELHQNIWESVDLVQKEIKKQISQPRTGTRESSDPGDGTLQLRYKINF